MRSELPQEADYVVIGGGASGCAAARVLLTESSASVCLLEAGGTNQRPDARDPAAQRYIRADASATWAYDTVPQGGTANRVHQVWMGRILGGSSTINGMMYMRGAPWDFDEWAAAGNHGWDADSVYATYRRIEGEAHSSGALMGKTGPLKLTHVAPGHPLTNAFLSACERLGYRPSTDFNGRDPEGYALHHLNLSGKSRNDAAQAFLDSVPDERRARLRVILNALACQLVFDHTQERVVGVRYLCDGRLQEVRVGTGVLLCAGAIASPQLLMLSGIGPEKELSRHSIAAAIAAPAVGENLHDHIGASVAYEARPFPDSIYGCNESGLYLRSSDTCERYDLQIAVKQFCERLPGSVTYSGIGFTLLAGLLSPRSRGTIRLKSPDPTRTPLVDPAYLRDDQDLERLAAAVVAARRIGADPAFDAIRIREISPGVDTVAVSAVRDYVRHTAWTWFHPVGTCRMGADDDAVVDPTLLVNGTSNLRVADASIMPTITSGNTNAPAMMIGWRGAELALADTGAAENSRHADAAQPASPRALANTGEL